MSVNALKKGSQIQAREICMTAMPFNETLQSVPDSTFNETRIEESFFNPEINFEYKSAQFCARILESIVNNGGAESF